MLSGRIPLFSMPSNQSLLYYGIYFFILVANGVCGPGQTGYKPNCKGKYNVSRYTDAMSCHGLCLNYLDIMISQTWKCSVGSTVFFNKLLCFVSELHEKHLQRVGIQCR